MVYMKSPLIYDQKDFKWNLLGEIIKISIHAELSKNWLKKA